MKYFDGKVSHVWVNANENPEEIQRLIDSTGSGECNCRICTGQEPAPWWESAVPATLIEFDGEVDFHSGQFLDISG